MTLHPSETEGAHGSGGGQVVNVASSGLGPKLISPKIVEQLTSLKRRSIDRAVKSGRFPEPVRLSDGRIAYFEAEIFSWIEALPRVKSAGDRGTEAPDANAVVSSAARHARAVRTVPAASKKKRTGRAPSKQKSVRQVPR